MDSVIKCPVCEQTETNFIREAFDDRYGHPDLFSLVRCVQCDHVMTRPRLCESELGTLYSTYYPRKHVNVQDLISDAARAVLPFAKLRRWWAGTDNQGQYAVRPAELMLDIGCGSGLSLLEARALGADVRGIEADPNIRRIADELGLDIHIGSLLDQPFEFNQFDLVVLNQVIEHVPDPALMLDRLRSRIRPGGRVVLVFPNVQSLWCKIFRDRWINWHIPYHFHHFSRKNFENMARRIGYQVKSVRTITPNLWTVLQFRASILHANRSEPSTLWSQRVISSTASLDKNKNLSVSFRIGRFLLVIVRKLLPRRIIMFAAMFAISFANRIIDSLGLGDSLMIEIVPIGSE